MVQVYGASGWCKRTVQVNGVRAWVQANGIDIDIGIGIGIDISIDAGVGDLCHQQYVLYLYQNMFFFVKVKAVQDGAGFVFWGKTRNSTDVEKLTLAWLKENVECFPIEFLTQCQQSPGNFQKVKITAGKPQRPKIFQLILNGRRFVFHRQGQQSFCCPYALANALSYMQYHNASRYMFQQASFIISSSNNTFTQSMKVLENYGVFDVRKTGPPLLHPAYDYLDHPYLVFLQLCSVSRLDADNDGLWDNTHAIAIFDNLIFDANQNKPLSLSEENIDLCLTGGPEYVYHHVSKGYVFSAYNKQ